MYAHILVPTDGSPLSTKAAKSAIGLAKALGARITALHVIPAFTPPVYMDGIVPYPELYSSAEYKRSTEAYAKKMLAKVEERARAAKVPCATVFVTGEQPWRAIVRTARSKKCDLIAMASHGRGGVEAVLLGSETTKVLTHSKTPVLVCR